MRSGSTTPDDYVAALDGWQLELVTRLRKAVLATRGFEEAIRYGHLVYSFDGPVLLIRAEAERVLFGFWRGQRLLELEPRLKPGGKYDLATLELREGDTLKPAVARRLAKEAKALNEQLGDPRDAAQPRPAKRAKKASRAKKAKKAKKASKAKTTKTTKATKATKGGAAKRGAR